MINEQLLADTERLVMHQLSRFWYDNDKYDLFEF